MSEVYQRSLELWLQLLELIGPEDRARFYRAVHGLGRGPDWRAFLTAASDPLTAPERREQRDHLVDELVGLATTRVDYIELWRALKAAWHQGNAGARLVGPTGGQERHEAMVELWDDLLSLMRADDRRAFVHRVDGMAAPPGQMWRAFLAAESSGRLTAEQQPEGAATISRLADMVRDAHDVDDAWRALRDAQARFR